MKRILTFVLALLMLFTAGCSSAHAIESSESGDMFDAIAENRPIPTEASKTPALTNSAKGSAANTPKAEDVTPKKKVLAMKEKWYGDPETGYLRERIEYNTKGKVVKSDRYFDDYLIESEVYEYDDSDRVIKILDTCYDRDGNITKIDETVDDGINYIKYSNGVMRTWMETFRDNSGRIVKTIYHMDGGFEYKEFYEEIEYDAKGRKSKETEHWSGTITETFFEYDEAGELKKSEKYKDGIMVSETVYSDDGESRKAVEYQNGEISQIIEYNHNGQPTKRMEPDSETGSLQVYTEYQYNDENQKVLRISKDDYYVYSSDDEQYIPLSGYSVETVERNNNGFITKVGLATEREGIYMSYDFEYDEEGHFSHVKYPTGYNYVDRDVYYQEVTYVYKYW